MPLSYAEKILGNPSLLASRPGGGADARLVFQCNLLEIACRMAEITLGIEAMRALGPNFWAARINDDLKALELLQQSIQTSIGAYST